MAVKNNKSSPKEFEKLKPPYQYTNYTPEQARELNKCMQDPVYFIENYMWVQHPVKGRILFNAYEFQKELLRTYASNRNVISMIPRQAGKTQSTVGYLLWYAMFHDDVTVLICANKFGAAGEIMGRVKFAYEDLPNEIRAGVVKYNERTIEFDNGSRIKATTTTPDSGRGMSVSLLYCLDGDSTVKIRNKKTLVEEDVTLRELYCRLSIDKVDNEVFSENDEYEILTPSGWKDFRGLTCIDGKLTYTITIDNGQTITATSGHYLFNNNVKIKISDLNIGDYIDTVDGNKQVISITENDKTEVFDIIEVDDINHQFIVNNCFITKNCDEFAFVRPNMAREFWSAISPTLATGGKCIITSTPNSDEDQFAELWFGATQTIDENGNELPNGLGVNGFKAFSAHYSQVPGRDEEWANQERAKIGAEKFEREYECKFVGEESTLVSSITLQRLRGIDPIFKTNDTRWYDKPALNRTYLVSLDPSAGVGRDSSCVQVWSLPDMVQVAEWTSNRTNIPNQVKTLQNIVNKIYKDIKTIGFKGEPEIYYTVENNSWGEAALQSIAEIGEENFMGQFLHEPRRSGTVRFRKGLHTSNRTKVNACTKLKSLIESNKMIINSKLLIKQLKFFVQDGEGFSAKTGEHDDTVMATVLCVRMMQMVTNWDDNIGELMKDVFDDNSGDERAPLPFSIMIS
jgi:hypothetical protein